MTFDISDHQLPLTTAVIGLPLAIMGAWDKLSRGCRAIRDFWAFRSLRTMRKRLRGLRSNFKLLLYAKDNPIIMMLACSFVLFLSAQMIIITAIVLLLAADPATGDVPIIPFIIYSIQTFFIAGFLSFSHSIVPSRIKRSITKKEAEISNLLAKILLATNRLKPQNKTI